MAIQLLGQDGSTVAGADSTMMALRTTLRPMEVTSWLSVGAVSGNLTGAAANSAVFSFRNLSANPVIIRHVGVGFIATTGFTSAQQLNYGLKVARAFSASDSGGTAVALTGNNCKVRTSLSTLTSIDCRISSTGALTAGTKTLDTNDLGVVGGWALAATAGVIITPTKDNLFSQDAGDYPLVLAQNEGINIMNLTAMGAAGVGILYANVELAEAVSY